jgi:[acyl-carrier-protein] S-malonyltransferase
LEELTLTVNLQPALTLINLLCLQSLAGLKPQAAAGHSLGELSALAASGVLPARRVLYLAARRGAIMHQEALKNPGGMAAVMGLEASEVDRICAQAAENGKLAVQAANYNTPQQTVITGSEEGVAKAVALVKQNKGKAIPLKVSGPWHSSLMKGAAAQMAEVYAGEEFAPASCLYYPNSTGSALQDPAAIKGEIMRQITEPVRWVKTIENMLATGINVFVEVGPKNVLSAMIKKIVSSDDVQVYNVETWEDAERLKKFLQN